MYCSTSSNLSELLSPSGPPRLHPSPYSVSAVRHWGLCKMVCAAVCQSVLRFVKVCCGLQSLCQLLGWTSVTVTATETSRLGIVLSKVILTKRSGTQASSSYLPEGTTTHVLVTNSLLNCFTQSNVKHIKLSTPYRVYNTENRVQNTEYWIQSTEYRVKNTEYRIQSTEYKIQNTEY